MSTQFADFTWPSRWNRAETVAALSQDGAEAEATGFFGVIRFRLDGDDAAALANHARQFANMVESAKLDFEAGGKSFSEMLAEDKP